MMLMTRKIQQNVYLDDNQENLSVRDSISENIYSHYGSRFRFSLGLLNGKGWHFYNDKKFKKAIGHYRTVLEINPEHSNAYAYWGASLSAMDKLEDAVSKLEESLVLNRFNSQAYAILIDVLFKQRKYERAWKMVKNARSDNVSLPQDSIERLSKVFPEPA